jgi:heme/copper-type cytochrome/quinol oxidase subunit 2
MLLAASQIFASPQQTPEQPPPVVHVTIIGKAHTFSPARIEVKQGTVVKITLVAEDMPHGFMIDEYRIAKRVSPGRSITFEFLADRAGRFTFYCGMTADERCREMRGELIVLPISASPRA